MLLLLLLLLVLEVTRLCTLRDMRSSSLSCFFHSGTCVYSTSRIFRHGITKSLKVVYVRCSDDACSVSRWSPVR